MPAVSGSPATLVINELNSDWTGAVTIELYVVAGGHTGGFVLSNQGLYTYLLPDRTVATGDYLVIHDGPGGDAATSTNHVWSFNTGGVAYPGASDNLVLIGPAVGDTTTLANSAKFAGAPVDYIAYGTGVNIKPVPTSQLGVTVPWNSSNQASLTGIISLNPNGQDNHSSADWEVSGSGTTGFIPFTTGPNSIGADNTPGS